MRIYIIEDDITVISILEDIVEQNELGTICGDTADAPPDLEGILAADPDLILVDLLMPGKDGIQVVRELKEGGSRAKFIMISQVSAKEMVARAYSAGVEYFTPANSGMAAESCHIWNNYLRGVDSTIQAMVQLTQGLEELDRPVVLVLFGDHKPWGGNGNSAYADMGLTFDLGTLQGFYDYYATPYLIWANAAAKEICQNGSRFLPQRFFRSSQTKPPQSRISPRTEATASTPANGRPSHRPKPSPAESSKSRSSSVVCS